MLQNTFIHIPQVSSNAEINIWKNNIHTWNDFLDKQSLLKISSTKKSVIASNLDKSFDALKHKDFNFFKTLPNNQHWRMYTVLSNRACFLDIETTGLSKYNNEITLIGIHGNDETKIFMNGKNLEQFDKELKKYDMIITFNGKCFDMPFIKQKFPAASLDHYHVDLRYVMADLGLRGGLKKIEVEEGIARDSDLNGVDGFEAVRLWHKYQRGDNSSLVTLKKYLTADVENLKILMDRAVIRMKQKHFEEKIK
jgi:hypothetical protein